MLKKILIGPSRTFLLCTVYLYGTLTLSDIIFWATVLFRNQSLPSTLPSTFSSYFKTKPKCNKCCGRLTDVNFSRDSKKQFSSTTPFFYYRLLDEGWTATSISYHSLTTSAQQYRIDLWPFRTPVHIQTLSFLILNCWVDLITCLTKIYLIYIYFFRFAARFEANRTAQVEWYEYSCHRRSSSGGRPRHCWCNYFCYLVEAKEKFFGW